MIDDPLQTIDDISAISVADLLSNFPNIDQIIISTHEKTYSEMFKYKFNKVMDNSCIKIDIQEKYYTYQKKLLEKN
jgi:ABC-type lipoprotein export system ATPase subunit